jgi:hypothetical protein
MRKTFKKIKKLDTVYHPETNFVCKSIEDKRIIGKWINKELVDLEDEDYELMNEWKFEVYEEEGVEETKGDGELEEEDNKPEDVGEEAGEEEEADGELEEEDNKPEDVGEEAGEEEEADEEETDGEGEKTVVDKEVKPVVEEHKPEKVYEPVSPKKNNGIKLFEDFYDNYNNKVAELAELKSEYEKLNQEHELLKEKFKKVKSLFD